MLLSLLVFFGTAQAQESVNAAGSDATGTGGTVAFSIGQCFYSSSYTFTGSVNEGVQQVYDIIPVGNKENTNGINLTMFPNPTSGNFTLAIKSPNQSIFSYQILDMQGKLLFTKEINSPEMRISISELPVANYFLNVLNAANRKPPLQRVLIIKKDVAYWAHENKRILAGAFFKFQQKRAEQKSLLSEA